MRQRIKLEQRTRSTLATGGYGYTTTATETRWADAVAVTAEEREQYQSIDKVVEYQLRFRGKPTIDLKGTRFVWITDGHPNEDRIYEPAAPAEDPEGVGREVYVLVSETGEEE